MYWSESRQRWVAAWKGRKRYGRTQAEAAAKLAKLKKADGHRAGTVGAIIDWWTDEHLPMRLADGSITESTVHDYTHSMTLWAPLRRIRIEDLTAADVDRRMHQLRTLRTARGRDGYSASKRRGALTALRQAFVAARRAGLLPPGRTAPENASTPPVRTEAPPLVTPDVAAAVLGKLVGDRDERAIVVALSLGLRIGETLGLTWDCIDLDAGTIRVHRQLRRVGEAGAKRWVLAPTKGKNDVVLALPCHAIDALREQRRRQAEERLAAGDTWSEEIPDLVFRRAGGEPVWSTSIATKVGDACDSVTADPSIDLVVPRMASHAFARHGHATLLRLAGASLDDIREQLRHTQVSTSERYAHVVPEVRRRTAGMIDDMLG